MRNYLTSFLLLLLMAFLSCKKQDDAKPASMDYDYYPIYSGHSTVYQVDSIVYDNFYNPVKVTDYHYKLKLTIADSFQDNTGKYVYRLLRYKMDSDTTAWVISDVWQVSRSTTAAFRTEENRKFTKMAFPIEPYKTWNGNAFNDLGKQEYQYLDFADTTINNIPFKHTITVEEENNKNLIENDYAAETYSEGIGLVARNYWNLQTDFDGNIQSGLIYKQVIISWE